MDDALRGDVVNIAVLTDCTILRAGFETIINGAEFTLAGFAATTAEMMSLIDQRQPDVVILPGDEHALEACRTITRRNPGIPVLVVSAGLDDRSVRGAIQAGALGFIFKDVTPADFSSAVRRLVAGESVLDTRVAGRVIAWASDRAVVEEGDNLSPRETEVLRLLMQGEPNKRIGRQLGLTENTVKTYLRRAYRKLGCSTRSEAAAIVARRGLL